MYQTHIITAILDVGEHGEPGGHVIRIVLASRSRQEPVVALFKPDLALDLARQIESTHQGIVGPDATPEEFTVCAISFPGPFLASERGPYPTLTEAQKVANIHATVDLQQWIYNERGVFLMGYRYDPAGDGGSGQTTMFHSTAERPKPTPDERIPTTPID